MENMNKDHEKLVFSLSSHNKAQDKVSARVNIEQDFEKEHQRLLGFTEEKRKKYHEICRQLISELRPEHLDQFAEVLMERQKHVLQDRDELIREMGDKLVHSLCGSLDTFWDDYDVANRLSALEMLKDEYKKFEGNTWNVLKMTPLQRTLPLRVRYKEARLQYLEKQVAYQNEQLKNLMKINQSDRSRINEMNELRRSVLMDMTCCTKDMEEINSQAQLLTSDVLSLLEK